MTLTKLGYIRRDLESTREWFFKQSATEQTIKSRYAFDRTHKWFGYHVILTNPPVITKGYRDNRVTQLGNRILPGWHCALLCHYRPGGCMTPHRDHPAFFPIVASVNIGRARLRIGNQVHDLEDGEVISFNTDYEHELYPVEHERWSLTFRRIRPEFLPQLRSSLLLH